MAGPLEGLHVIELAEGWAGPFCAMELGDMGADVVKVEPPSGDFTRQLGPPFPQGESIPFLAINRSKRGITLDLETEQGKDVLRRLIQDADVLIESYPPGEADRMGIGYEAMKKLNPRLIYATVTPYGQEGPYRDRVGSELTTQMVAGWTAYFGEQGGPPVIMGGEQANLFTGKYLTIGILAALDGRARGGKGQRVDMSLLSALVGQPMAYVSDDFQFTPEERERTAAMRAGLSGAGGPNRGLATKDMSIDFMFYVSGYIPNDEAWLGFFRDIGAPHLAEDERFQTQPNRTANKKEMDAEMEKAMAKFTVYEVMDLCLKYGGMASPFHTLEAMANHPQAQANEMIITVNHPTLGELKMIGLPSWYHTSTAKVVLAPPTLGQHTIEVLGQAGLSQAEIENLLTAGVA
ncbi:MAG: CoA transferase [Dehalococcoidia bacterium]|nr:CoA transferase [Dehalococcoidia bacterium]